MKENKSPLQSETLLLILVQLLTLLILVHLLTLLPEELAILRILIAV
jgi:hypothetical protein